MRGLLDLVINSNSYYPIHAAITGYLDIADILSLQLVCKVTAGLYADLKTTQWSINTRLQPFFKDVVAFRNLQAKTNALICSGSAAAFFRRSKLTSKTSNGSHDEVLRMAVVSGQESAIGNFLENEGYTRHSVNPGSPSEGFEKVSRSIKHCKQGSDRFLGHSLLHDQCFSGLHQSTSNGGD
jgi:hypothetical protein